MHEKLTVTTPNAREIVMTRLFDAPPWAVFDAWTKPDLLARWFGPRGWSLVTCEIDLRVGGAFRFVSRQPSGREVGQRGIYSEILRPSRVVHSESWEDWNPGESLVTLEFEDDHGKTKMTHRLRFPTQEVRDMLLESGLTGGTGESFERLDEVLATKAGLVPHELASSLG